MASRWPGHTFDVYFRDTMKKDAFMVRLKSIRDCLTPRGQTQLSYHDLMLAMFDIVEGQATPLTTAADLIFFILPASLATSCPSKLCFCPVSTLMMINSRHLHWSFLTQCILTLWFRIFGKKLRYSL